MQFHKWFPVTISCEDIQGEIFDNIQSEIAKQLPDMLDCDMSNPWNDAVETSFKYTNTRNIIIDSNLDVLKSNVILNVNKFLEHHGIFNNEVIFHQSWINVSKQNGFQFDHNHIGCDISGVYYYQTSTTDGDILFQNPNPHGVDSITPHTKLVRYKPLTGRMLLFPAWLFHRVEINQTTHERISFTCNIKLSQN